MILLSTIIKLFEAEFLAQGLSVRPFIAPIYRLLWARARFAASSRFERQSRSAACGAPACPAHSINVSANRTAFRSFIAESLTFWPDYRCSVWQQAVALAIGS